MTERKLLYKGNFSTWPLQGLVLDQSVSTIKSRSAKGSKLNSKMHSQDETPRRQYVFTHGHLRREPTKEK